MLRLIPREKMVHECNWYIWSAFHFPRHQGEEIVQTEKLIPLQLCDKKNEGFLVMRIWRAVAITTLHYYTQPLVKMPPASLLNYSSAGRNGEQLTGNTGNVLLDPAIRSTGVRRHLSVSKYRTVS